MSTAQHCCQWQKQIVTAKRNVDSDNKFIKHQSAYMTQQSVEKTLKYLISLHKDGLYPGDMILRYKNS